MNPEINIPFDDGTICLERLTKATIGNQHQTLHSIAEEHNIVPSPGIHSGWHQIVELACECSDTGSATNHITTCYLLGYDKGDVVIVNGWAYSHSYWDDKRTGQSFLVVDPEHILAKIRQGGDSDTAIQLSEGCILLERLTKDTIGQQHPTLELMGDKCGGVTEGNGWYEVKCLPSDPAVRINSMGLLGCAEGDIVALEYGVPKSQILQYVDGEPYKLFLIIQPSDIAANMGSPHDDASVK